LAFDGMVRERINLVSTGSLGKLAWGAVLAIGKTLALEERIADEGYCRRGSNPFILVVWHGRMFVPMFYFRNTGVIPLVSEHRDGEIVTNTLHAAGYSTVRGSTTRGGVRALARLVRLARKGHRLGFTSDGPRGPRWRFQPGAVFVAAKTGLPLVPIAGSAERAYYFDSWDRFQLPMPFSRAVVNIGAPYFVRGGSDPENIERHRLEIERRLTDLTLEADRIAGVSGNR